MGCTTKKVNYAIFITGPLLFIIGISMGIAWPYVFDAILKWQLTLSPSSVLYNMWIKTPITIYLELYLYEWSNHKEFQADPSIKPEFMEVGPFVYAEVHERVDLTWNDNYTITFNETRTWQFLPDMSEDNQTLVTNLNMIAITVATYSKYWPPLYKQIVNTLLNEKEQLFLTRPAEEWLFTGIDTELLDLLNQLRNITDIPLPFTKFGWFFGRNESASYDGIFTMHTGEDDLFKVGVLDRWNRAIHTRYNSGPCGEVKGITGEIIPPMNDTTLENHLDIELFATDICRSLTLKYQEEVEVEGIRGWKYIGDDRPFDNGTKYPENACYCGTQYDDECVPTGMYNVSACRYGAPVFVSYPHMYLTDPIYAESIVGMNASREAHELYLVLEPMTGIPMDVKAQLQINALLRQFDYLDMFRDMREVYVPMLWFRQRATLTSDLASLAALLLNLPIIGIAVFYSIGGIGFLMTFTRFIVILRRHNRHSKTR